jgi:hypothetical protein
MRLALLTARAPDLTARSSVRRGRGRRAGPRRAEADGSSPSRPVPSERPELAVQNDLRLVADPAVKVRRRARPPPRAERGHPGEHARDDDRGYTGKVIGIHYGRFGDFEAFSLLTDEGYERTFRGREPAMEELVNRAWLERFTITVIVDRGSERPESVVLRRAR